MNKFGEICMEDLRPGDMFFIWNVDDKTSSGLKCVRFAISSRTCHSTHLIINLMTGAVNLNCWDDESVNKIIVVIL